MEFYKVSSLLYKAILVFVPNNSRHCCFYCLIINFKFLAQRAAEKAGQTQETTWKKGVICRPCWSACSCRMPLFRIERPENASLWMRIIKGGVYQLSISPFRGPEEERKLLLQANREDAPIAYSHVQMTMPII